MVRLPSDFWKIILRGRFKEYLRWGAMRLPGNVLRFSPSRYAIVRELAKLDIAECGQDDRGVPFVKLSSGLVFYSYPPDRCDLRLYEALPPHLARRIPKDCIRIANDVVCRWVYPHALAGCTPPYPIDQRIPFHIQHRDTIDDLPDQTNEQKAQLKSLFAVRPDDVVLDVGGYVGMGAIKLSELVGANGLVVSFEAHPVSSQLFEKNLRANRIENVRLMQMGVWNGPSSMTLNCERPQNNSLVEGHYETMSTVEVKTNSIDSIVGELGLTKISLVSLTINSAEVEAIQGMQNVLSRFRPKLTVAGWYKRNGVPVHSEITELLARCGYRSIVGPFGRVYSWHPDMDSAHLSGPV